MKRIGQTRVEWALLAVIALVCAVLSFLQYRWTGELSRAEPALLRAGLNEQLRRLAQVFNSDIRDSCTTLLPEAKDLRELDTGEAHRIRYAQWASSHDTSLFKRIGIATPEQGKLQMYGFGSEGRITPMEWPPVWEPFRTAMTARIAGSGRPPNAPPDSNLIELPVFAQRAAVDGPNSEVEWMIFELNEDYIRTSVMPRLAAEYLNPGGEPAYDVSVSRTGPGSQVSFSTRADRSSVATNADATAGIFSGDMGTAPGRGPGPFPDQGRLSRWTIAVRHRAGSLDAAGSGTPRSCENLPLSGGNINQKQPTL